MAVGVEPFVILSCIATILYIYGALVTAVALLDSFLVFIFVSCTLFGLVFWFRVPRPADAAVSHILGPQWGASGGAEENGAFKSQQPIKTVGHRACGLDAPENSISALNKIVAEGFKMVEFDVMLTADDIAVVFHDESLERMTEHEGRVSMVSYEELKSLDISVKHTFGLKFPNERIPTLEEFVSACLEKEIRMIIDLKYDGYSGWKIGSHILALFKKLPQLYEQAMVSSFNPYIIYEIRSKDPAIVCSLAWRPYYYSHADYTGQTGPSCPRYSNPVSMGCSHVGNFLFKWFLWNIGYYLLGISAVLIQKDVITSGVVNYWTKRHVRVLTWTVNLPTEKQYFEKSLCVTYLTDTAINS